MSMATASTGKTVYGNGSYAPNRGQVSAQGAQGYLQRELAKGRNVVSPVGRDGMSDQRSGVAATALKRVQPTPQKAAPSNGIIQNEGGKGNTTSAGNTTPPSNSAPATQTPQPVEPAGPVAPTMPPVVNINDAGTLELPFNYAYSQEVLGALGEYNDQLLGLQLESQQQGAEYAKNKRDAGVGYEGQKVRTLSDNASRGTAFSSGYGVAVGRDANQYTNYLNDLESSNTMQQNSYNMRRSAIVNAFNHMLQSAALNYGNDLTDSAGDLGYGSEDEEVPEETTGGVAPDFSGMNGYQSPTVPMPNLPNIPQNWSGWPTVTPGKGNSGGGTGGRPVVKPPRRPKKKK